MRGARNEAQTTGEAAGRGRGQGVEGPRKAGQGLGDRTISQLFERFSERFLRPSPDTSRGPLTKSWSQGGEGVEEVKLVVLQIPNKYRNPSTRSPVPALGDG
jgi:hypothetical protein